MDMDGDEMTHVIWKEVKDRLVFPFFDVDLKYFDLSLPNRDKTEDRSTQEAVKAVIEHGVGVKCPTISVDAKRIKEYKLKNGALSLTSLLNC